MATHIDAQNSNAYVEFGRFGDVESRFGLTRSVTYNLLRSGAIKSACVKKKGARHGVRLIDMQSVRDFLRANTK